MRRMPHPDIAQQSRKNSDLVVQGQSKRIDQEFDPATPNTKGHIVRAFAKSSLIDDSRTTRGIRSA